MFACLKPSSSANVLLHAAVLLTFQSLSGVIEAVVPVEYPIAYPRTGHLVTGEPPSALPKNGYPYSTSSENTALFSLVHLIPTNKWLTGYEFVV